MEFALTTDSLVKRFGGETSGVHALQGVSISVGHGEIYSLLGPNGAGKTTFIKCLLGIVFPTSGTGNILGYPLGAIKAKERIGYLPENHRYPLHLTGEQVLSYFGKLSGVASPTLEKRIDETLDIVGMKEWRNTRVRKYSKGMMQRIGLAQALINDPNLIILDEPTDGVDPVGRKEIREVLVRLRDSGKTIFLNSHLLSEVERISDRVAIMQSGKMITEGTVHDLTLSKNQYELKVSAHDGLSLPSILKDAVLREQDGQCDVAFGSLQELNAAIDSLRANNILIESLVPKRTSLEDIFIKLIGSAEVEKR
jgi:ABC-2 type transport system ATP-binding protein